MKKLRSRAGFSLTEMLIAVAVLAIMSAAGTVVTGTVLSTRQDMIEMGDAQVLASTTLEALAKEIRYGKNVRLDSGTVTLDSQFFGEGASFECDASTGRVRANGKDLSGDEEKILTDKAYTSLKITALTFAQASSGDGITVSLTVAGRRGELWSQELTVVPLNPAPETT